MKKSLLSLLDGVGISWSWKFWWTKVVTMRITVTRSTKTVDGILGGLSIDADPFTCFTLENLALAMPTGIYPVKMSYSPHFNRIMPHLIIPGHTDVMFHWANYPKQLEGCIAVGDRREQDAVDDSVITFNQFFKIIGGVDDLTVEIRENF